MAGFHEIIGHEQLIAHLQSAIVMDKVSHAYIINGLNGQWENDAGTGICHGAAV